MNVAIIVSRFNEIVTSALLKGALEYLQQQGISEERIKIFEVPGAFEIPLAAKKVAKSKKWEAIICLGAIIKGETAHFDLVAYAVTDGIMQVMLEYEIPIGYGILATNTLEEALNRAGGKMGNAGRSAAIAASSYSIP